MHIIAGDFRSSMSCNWNECHFVNIAARCLKNTDGVSGQKIGVEHPLIHLQIAETPKLLVWKVCSRLQ